MKTVKTIPGAKRLMESLRHLGYDCSIAIADLIDNSIEADASEIYIDINTKIDPRFDTIPKREYHPATIVIADNGTGMSKEKLQEAMRFGSKQEYSPRDLGKYGLGLKTASLSQCRILTVSSKEKSGSGIRPRRHFARWDIDHVYKTDDWDMIMPEEGDLEPWEKEVLCHGVAEENGTVVLWAGLDDALPLLSSSSSEERERFMARLIEEISGHVQMVFHRFIQGAVTGKKKLNISISGRQLSPWDPFCKSEATQELDILRLPIVSVDPDGSKMREIVTINPFILPREDEFSSRAAWNDASGPKNWNQQQGLYFYRNNRLLQAGGWSRLRSPDEHTKLIRIAVDFPGELDRAFSINVTKMKARIPAEIREDVKTHVSGWVRAARSRYDGVPGGVHTGKEKSALSSVLSRIGFTPDYGQSISPKRIICLEGNNGELDITYREDHEKGTITIFIPPNHEFSEIFTSKGSQWDIHKFSMVVLDILEAVKIRKVPAEKIPLGLLKKIFQNYL